MLASQQGGLTCELVNVKQLEGMKVTENSDGSFSEAPLTTPQLNTVIKNCNLLKRHVAKALKDGYYPIILGGDNCQTLGSANALKSVSPGTKTLWLDSMIDINLEGRKGFNVLEMQTGMSFQNQQLFDREQQFILKQLKCMDLSKDLIFVGACRDDNSLESIQHVLKQGGLVYDNRLCKPDQVEQLFESIHKQVAFREMTNRQMKIDYWISCNMNALDSIEFRSKTRSGPGLKNDDGVSLEFLGEFMKEFANQSVGMDLSDVNFEVTSESSQKHADEQTFREFFELILDSINRRDESHPLLSSFAYDAQIAKHKAFSLQN